MNWPTRILGIFVIITVASLVAVVSRQNLLTPRQVLENVQAEMQGESFDEQALLRRLASSIRRAEAGDLSLPATRELCADLRTLRGRLYLDIGATREARADFESVLENYLPGDREIRRLLIRAESKAGDVHTALAHLDELLIEQPDFGSAMVEKGHLHQELAQEALELCDEKLRFVLVETDAEKGSKILRTLASRDPSDPARATIILELKKLFPASADESLGQILGFCEEASGHLTACREAYVKSFSLGLDPVALTRYLAILDNAGRTDEALRLGSIVALEGPERADPDSAVLLIRMLMDRGNFQHAADLTTTWVEGDPPLNAEFLRLGCEALWRAEKWATLTRVAYKLRSIGSLEDEVICAFYTGYAQANSSKPRHDKALIALMDFATSRTQEPFKGAREQAWREIARLQGERQQLSREREAIQAALDLDPLLAGALWLRRAEIQLETPHNGYRLPLDSWAEGMRLAPRRTAELLPRFEELGKLTLQAEERNIDVIFEDLKRENRKFPTRDYGPYVLYRIAQMHGEEGNWSGQLAASQRLLDKFPDFLAALDLAIDARGNLGDRGKYIDLVLYRVELAGLDERAQALVDSIRIDEYSKPQLVRMMQADPRNTGRMVVTRWYYENGETAAAIETLESNSKSTRTDDETLFGTQVLMADGDYRTALRWLDEIEERSPIHKIKLRLAVSCAMSLGKTDEILTRLAALLAEEELGPHEILLLADLCLRVNQPQATELLLGRIAPGDIDDPGELRRRNVILALRMSESKQASAVIERSAAFLSEAEYLVSRLLLDAADKDWTRAARNAVDLRKTDLIQKPLVDVLIDLIAGDPKRAYENTQFALQLTPLVPKWILADNIARLGLGEDLKVPAAYGSKAKADMEAFLKGRGRDIIDPRSVAVLILASELEGYDPLVLAVLNSMETNDRGSLWRQIVKADLQSETGDNTGAIPTYELVLRSHSDCLPAWDALEAAKVKHHSSASHPQVVNVRNRRMLSLAQADPEGAAGLLVGAGRLERKGDLQGALRMTLRAQQLAPKWFEARIAVAQLYSELGHWEPALEEWRSLVESRNPAEVTRSVAGYIRALSRASVTNPPVIRMSEIKAELDALDKKLPNDPRVVLALAHIDLMIDANNPAFGLERAWSRLRTLRDKFEGVSLEDMQRGATQAWSKFYVDTDPDSAEQFILSELHRQPGNLYLWRLLGRVYRDLDRFTESIDVLNRVALMVPSEEVQMELATSYAALGADPKVVARVVGKARQLRAGGKDSLEGQLLIAEALLSTFAAKDWAEAITLLEAVWEARHELEVPALRTKLASLYGRALLLRGEPGDARRAVNVLTQELNNAEVPYQHEYFTCLMGLGKSFDNVQE